MKKCLCYKLIPNVFNKIIVNEINSDSMNIIPSINHLNEYSQLILELNVPKTWYMFASIQLYLIQERFF